MAWDTTCLEVARSGDNLYLLDAKDYALGPLAVLSQTEYHDRLDKVIKSGDTTSMFDTSEQHATLREGELRAFAAYAAAGLLSNINDEQTVIAYENMRDLTDKQNLCTNS